MARTMIIKYDNDPHVIELRFDVKHKGLQYYEKFYLSKWDLLTWNEGIFNEKLNNDIDRCADSTLLRLKGDIKIG